MKQNNLVKLIGIALVVAIIATGVFYGLFVTKLSSSTGSGKMVVVAAKPISAGTVLAEKDVQSIPWAVEGTPAGAFEAASQVAGRTVVQPLAQGEPVLQSPMVHLPFANEKIEIVQRWIAVGHLSSGRLCRRAKRGQGEGSECVAQLHLWSPHRGARRPTVVASQTCQAVS